MKTIKTQTCTGIQLGRSICEYLNDENRQISTRSFTFKLRRFKTGYSIWECSMYQGVPSKSGHSKKIAKYRYIAANIHYFLNEPIDLISFFNSYHYKKNL